MKTKVARFLWAIVLAALLAGCSAGPAALPSATPGPDVTVIPPASNMPSDFEPLTAPTDMPSDFYPMTSPTESPTATSDEGAEQRETFKKMKIQKGDWVYYADWKQMAYIGEGYECPIKRIKKDGSNDTDLGITGFKFVLVGESIYVKKNLSFGDFGHWDTVRMDLDGGNKKQMEYANMDIKVYGERIYFDTFNESVLYAADSACENVTKYEVKLPDEEAIKKKLGEDYSYAVYVLDIKEVKDGWIYFYYGLVDTGGMPFYEGHYRMSLDGKTAEKTDKGTYN